MRKRAIIHRTIGFVFICLILSVVGSPYAIGVAFLGDVMLGRDVGNHLRGTDLARVFQHLQPNLSDADLAVANLESPLTTAPLMSAIEQDVTGYDLRADPELAQFLRISGIDIVSLANNHIHDSGDEGVRDTLKALADAGIVPIGPDLQVVWINRQSTIMAFIAVDDVSQPIDIESTSTLIRQARSQGGIVVVSVHWGNEFHAGPSGRQRAIAQMFADAGAHMIWGHHPHVLQPIEWLQGENQSDETLVVYSLGNALFDQYVPQDARQSILLSVTFTHEGVRAFDVIPFVINIQEKEVSQPDRATEARIMQRLNLATSSGNDP